MKKILLLVPLAMFLGAASAQPAKHRIAPLALHQLDSLYRYLDSTGLYNGTMLVGVGGRKVSAAAIGYANLDTRERLRESSPFNLASVSKQFTAVGVLRLVAAGRLRLDQYVATVLPGFPYGDVTIRHLLNHTGGLPEYHQLIDSVWDKRNIATNNDLLAMLARVKPAALFPPGSKWDYSNTGYALLASVIEKTSGKTFADYMQQEVFGPLQLKHTFVHMPRLTGTRVANYALSYARNEAGALVEPDSIPELRFVRYLDGICGQGRISSTVTDLLAWNNAVRDRKLLPAALWDEATTPPVIGGESTGYGFGLEVVTSPERGRVLRHSGSWPAYITNNVLYLDKDVSLIYLTNQEQADHIYQATYEAVKNIVFGKPFVFPAPLVRKEAAIDTSLYNRYVGRYATPEMADFEVIVSSRGGRLYAQASGQPELSLVPESDTVFFIPEMPVRIEFKSQSGAPATAMILHQNGAHEFKRK